MIARRRDGRGRGGEDDTTVDNNDDNNDNNDDDEDNNEDNDNNNNITIKQCLGVRGRRKTVAAWMTYDDKKSNCYRGTVLRVSRRRNT
jgi:hypothetical protein